MIAMKFLLIIAILIFPLFAGCTQSQVQAVKTRQEALPSDTEKFTPEMDDHPPIMHSDEWEAPVPLGASINTKGAEDSPFVLPDGSGLYFFFTPDVRVPVEKQLLDGVTGIYVSKWAGNGWVEAERVMLQDPGRLALDGCEFVQGNTMLFCSAREGYEGLHWFSAKYSEGKWRNWKNADFEKGYEVGELHITRDGKELYFHSQKAPGKGGYDVWMSENKNGKWQAPKNLEAINTPENEGWPFVSHDGKELWFLRTHMGSPAIFRSIGNESGWSRPELIVSQFAGEPTLDDAGNLYFVHHYYKEGTMMEADIYFAARKK